MPLILPTATFGRVNFGSIFCAPGARGFYGEGYPTHAYLKYLGLTWRGTAFAGKTITLLPRQGNMPLEKDGVTPCSIVPPCIIPKPWSGHMLNAVGLSNFGVQFYMDLGKWQKLTQPFCLSWMAVSETKEERLEEAREFVRVTTDFFHSLRTPVALQVNRACPSIKTFLDDPEIETTEIIEILEILATLKIPLILNFNPLVPIELLVAVSEHPAVSALWIANTIPWGSPGVDWMEIFGADVSPLITRGFKQAGGLSGPACLRITIRKLYLARHRGITIPIVAGNGIQCTEGVQKLRGLADAIAIGCVALMRPWRMKSIISAAHRCFD